ncbi:Actin cytoskeleton-regulatory complex protein sla1 [Colletotrichum trifolii]|uniref:Actin cytoskeleton-regulatory complex protein SLA1 n=1 Tax=Colletotrichum trifolii TaxID=5466 RepID=A0A4R8PUT3_COLTR|nr:Actin cytoskeleton-regulatory complex protein sla1 [Colletotrichum trifolii]
MGFLGVCKAIYDYTPQAEGELSIKDGDLLYIIEKNSEDDWWKAKKKASADDEEEPEGLVPNNYVQDAQVVTKARALYEYTRQTDEELSFTEDAVIDVYDTSDPDWILVGLDGDFGFVPANYIELGEQETVTVSSPPPQLPLRSVAPTATSAGSDVDYERVESMPPLASSRPNNAAAALAEVMSGRSASQAATPPLSPQSPSSLPSEDEAVRSPALPARPASQMPPARSPRSIDTHMRENSPEIEEPPYRAPGGFHMYNINEMVSVMGKRKKMPTTLGINLATGTILIAPERAQDGPSQEWTADKMTHYSREGKHVFLELVRPSKSVDFHAGAKDTAEEIVSALGELAGAVRAEGLREVILAGTSKSHRKGQVLYDFEAQGHDEVTVFVGDDVVIVDDSKSEEWWQVRRVKDGKEGVVPSSYIEVTGAISPPPSNSGLTPAKSTVEQNRLEEIRLTKEAVKAAQRDNSQQRSKRENGRGDIGSQGRSGKAKPDPTKVRTWTDRSKSFSVEAQFLGLKDGKINLHKMNGVKIAVPVAKMSVEDLEYVERITGISLDEDKPLSNVKKARAASHVGATKTSAPAGRIGASVGQSQKPEHDWFQFFLSCDVAVGLCERYAQAFSKDSMDESVLPDVDATVLRNLGLREGDILKVMRTLDQKFGRVRDGNKAGDGDAGSSGGLFSGPGGALRNNTRKGRPAPAIQTSDVVDPKAFSQRENGSPEKIRSEASAPVSSAPTPDQAQHASGGFDDDAWDVKPAQQSTKAPPMAATAVTPTPSAIEQPPTQPSERIAPAKQVPALTGSMQDLSLLTQPLEPMRTAQSSSSAASAPPPAQVPQPPGSSPSSFGTNQFTPTQQQPTGFLGHYGVPAFNPQATGINSFLPPALDPQRTGMPAFQPQQTGMGGFGNMGSAGNIQPSPLQPQKTGPPPPVRFGVTGEAKKLISQPTGRRANLSQATVHQLLA